MTCYGEEFKHSKQRFYIPPKLLHVLINTRDSGIPTPGTSISGVLTLYSPEMFKVEPPQGVLGGAFRGFLAKQSNLFPT